MEGALYYYFGIPKNPVNEAMVAAHYKEFKAAAGLLHRRRLLGRHGHRHCAENHQRRHQHQQAHSTMEGMSFDTPKGKMTFRKEDHQAMQSMYHFRIKADPAFAWGVPELVREIKPEEMNIPIRNKR
jgi:branched-chain amino acid transport system substrate-binding protein